MGPTVEPTLEPTHERLWETAHDRSPERLIGGAFVIVIVVLFVVVSNKVWQRRTYTKLATDPEPGNVAVARQKRFW